MRNTVLFERLILAVLFSAAAASASAQELLLYFPMESPDNGNARLYTDDGGSAVAVPGKIGKALKFSGKAVLAQPFALDHAEYPQVTVTAWVKQDAGVKGSRTIFHSGSTAGITMAVTASLAMRTGGRSATYRPAKLPADSWVFVAAVLDTSADMARLHQNDGEPYVETDLDSNPKPPRDYADPNDPESGKTPYVFIGGNDFRTFYGTSRPIAIDDVRVYAGALSPEDIAAIRDHGGAPDEIIGETEKNDDGPAAKETGVADLPGDQYDLPGDQYDPEGALGNRPAEDGAVRRAPGGLPGSLENPDVGQGPAGAPELEQTQGGALRRAPGALPDSLENPDVDQTPAGAPELEYESFEAAEEAARRRAETAAENEAQDQQQSLQARKHVYPTGERRFSGISGYRGEITEIIELPSQFMKVIRWKEKNNRPTKIRIEGLFENPPAQVVEWGDGGLGPGYRYVGTPYVISRLEICSTKNRNRRMKGLRIYGPTVLQDGSLREEPNQDSAEMPNCGRWRPAVICPEGLATGLVVHADTYGDGYGNKQEIVGLQLVCRAVAVR